MPWSPQGPAQRTDGHTHALRMHANWILAYGTAHQQSSACKSLSRRTQLLHSECGNDNDDHAARHGNNVCHSCSKLSLRLMLTSDPCQRSTCEACAADAQASASCGRRCGRQCDLHTPSHAALPFTRNPLHLESLSHNLKNSMARSPYYSRQRAVRLCRLWHPSPPRRWRPRTAFWSSRASAHVHVQLPSPLSAWSAPRQPSWPLVPRPSDCRAKSSPHAKAGSSLGACS